MSYYLWPGFWGLPWEWRLAIAGALISFVAFLLYAAIDWLAHKPRR